jgi:F-type H+-transporting ATPase subunit delta
MTRQSPVARRYAEALSAALDDSALAGAAEQLRTLARMVADSNELRAVLSNPAIPSARRSGLVRSLLEGLDPSPQMVRFIDKMGHNERLPLIGEISEVVDRLLDERRGRVQAEVTTARPLDEAHRAKIREALGRLTGQTVHLAEKVDPALIGGVVTRIGSTVYDGSLKSRLAGLKERILRSS